MSGVTSSLSANKANKVLGLIRLYTTILNFEFGTINGRRRRRRTFYNLDEEMLVLLYKSLVRPHLEYCHAVVYTQYVKHEKMLEGVQRRATRLVQQIRNKEYPERL